MFPTAPPTLVRAAIAATLLLATGAARADDPVPSGGAGRSSQPVSGQGQGTTDTFKVVALVGAGVAVVGLGAGTAYGVTAISRKNDAEKICPGSSVCATQEGVSKWSSAASAANVSTLLFAVAGLGALEAAVFWLMPSSNGTGAQVGIGPGVLQVRAAW
jgi:hypothetical protein